MRNLETIDGRFVLALDSSAILINEDNGKLSSNVVDQAELAINTVEYQISGLRVEGTGATGSGFDSQMRGSGCAVLKSFILRRNDRPLLTNSTSCLT